MHEIASESTAAPAEAVPKMLAPSPDPETGLRRALQLWSKRRDDCTVHMATDALKRWLIANRQVTTSDVPSDIRVLLNGLRRDVGDVITATCKEAAGILYPQKLHTPSQTPESPQRTPRQPAPTGPIESPIHNVIDMAEEESGFYS